MAQEIHDKIRELHGLIEDKKDVLYVLYRGSESSTQCMCGTPLNITASIAAAMVSNKEFAKIVEMAYDAYTAHKMNEKLKNKEI